MSRTRNYATVVYPDSAPEGWENILSMHHVSYLISPLHDRDINPTGEEKKPHYHVMIMFENTKTVEQAIEIFQTIGGVGVEIVKSLRGYARYLCHLDNPDKAQYNVTDVIAGAGADYLSIIELVIDDDIILHDILIYADENDIDSFFDLVMYLYDFNFPWYRTARKYAYFLNSMLKSRRSTIKERNLIND